MNLEYNFLTTIDLPFNHACVDDVYQMIPPDQDPGGEGCWLILQGMGFLVVETSSGFDLPHGDCPVASADPPAVYMGQWCGRPCRLLEIPEAVVLTGALQRQPLRSENPDMAVALFSIGGVGFMMRHWEKVSRHCGNCGAQMKRIPGGWGKVCSGCSAQHFPRIHPCVIGLIVKGDEILLARRPGAPDGRYGLVAGFVDFGESLEEAMMRETLEETGLEIANIRYVGSQSWPFPSQLMCGFVADYVSGEIELRDQELDDAIWCRLDQLPTIPPQRSIARYLIDHAGDYLKG